MPTPTYTPLANITLGSTTASVTFSSISGAYRDLVLVAQVKSASDNKFFVRLNGATSGHSSVSMEGNGSSTASSASGAWPEALVVGMGWNSINANEWTPFTVNLMDYSATDKHKSALLRGGSANNLNTSLAAVAGRYASTSAVTSLLIYGNANWDSGSTFALYGVSA